MFAISEFLRTLGYAPLVYWLVAAGSLALLFVTAFAPAVPAEGRKTRGLLRVGFPMALLVAMVAWRWPAILHFKAVNPDEPQFLAGALTLLAKGRFWWTDPTTSGPLVVLPLAAPGLVGLPVNFTTGRIVALLLEWAGVVLLYLTLRHVHGDRRARLLVLPPACLMVFLLFWDFVPYCSELSPSFLSALAVWLGVTAFSADGRVISRTRLFASGVVLGILPFSKFQVLPIGAAIGVSLAAWTLRQPGAAGRERLRDLLCLAGGTLAALAALLLSLWQSGLMADVYQSYVVHNLNYAQARALPWSESVYILRYLSTVGWGFATFHAGLLLLVLCGLRGARRADWRLLLFGWLLLLAAYVAVLTPGRLYPHYLLFLPLPLALLAGLQFGRLLGDSRVARAWLGLFLAVGVLPQVIERGWDRPELSRLIRPVAPWSDLAGFINRVKQPGDSLAVWGWRPELYVDTQLPQATREAHTNAQLAAGPLRDYYRQRFLADLRENQPTFFIDSVGVEDFGYRDRERDGHETFPALAEYIGRQYVPINQAGSIRIYARRDVAR